MLDLNEFHRSNSREAKKSPIIDRASDWRRGRFLELPRLPIARIWGRLGQPWAVVAGFRFAPAGPMSSSRADTTPSATTQKRRNRPIMPLESGTNRV